MIRLDPEELAAYITGIEHRGHVDPSEVAEVLRKCEGEIRSLRSMILSDGDSHEGIV